MVLDETATLDFAATSVVHGLGVFTPVGGAPAVRLGLTCSISRTDESTVPCQGGVAQDFPALGTALGSVTTITLGLGTEATSPVTFTGASVLTAGSVGELTITAPTTTTLAVQGGASAGTTTASGGAAQFALFPPTPTGWSVVNPTDDLKFTIDVVSNTVRNLTATLTRISTGATLGTATLSQSGTGTISYSDGTSGAVTSWLLTK